MKIWKLLITISLTLSSLDGVADQKISGTAVIPNSPTTSTAHRQSRLKAFEADTSTVAAGGIVLLGDSLTEEFPTELVETTATLTNRGVNDETIAELLERADKTVADLKPAKVFLLIGTTDLTRDETKPDDFQAQYIALLQLLKKSSPDTKVYVQGIPPFRGDAAKHNDTIRLMNTRLEGIARSEQVNFIPLHNHFTDLKGELAPELTTDGVHLNKTGYQKWAAVLKRYLN